MDLFDELKNTGALLEGHFILTSGLHSDGYVQCAKLLQYPVLASEAGRDIAKIIREYSPTVVVSPAIGGLIIGQEVARAMGVRHIFVEKKDGQTMLRRGFEIADNDRVAIVEDVVTTGLSSMETAKVIQSHGGQVVVLASIINRSDYKFDFPFQFLLKLEFNTYSEEECPLCKEGIPAVKPGSREKKAGSV